MPETTARVAESPTAEAPAAVCRPRRQPIPAISIANTNDLTKPARKSVSVTALSTSLRNVENGIAKVCIVTAPPTRPTRSGE